MNEEIRTVGLPRALGYHRHAPMWHAFFRGLGVETVVSPDTNRGILESGCRRAVDETCLSIKVLLGHVEWLAERADAVLVPRYVSRHRGERECTKFFAAHDIARNSVDGARIIGYSVDRDGETHRATSHAGELYRLGRRLGRGPARSAWAVGRAVAAERFEEYRVARLARALDRSAWDRPRVLVAGHEYNLRDAYIGTPILRELEAQGVQVIESDSLVHRRAARWAKRSSPLLYWTSSMQVLGAIEYWRKRVDGIIFLVTFPCGPDSLVSEFAVRTTSGVPMVTLVVDEHAAEAGMRTRLESFVDLLRMRRGERVAGLEAGSS